MTVGEWWSCQVSGLQPYPITLIVRLRELNLAFEQQRSNGVRGPVMVQEGLRNMVSMEGRMALGVCWELGWGALAPLDWSGRWS